MKTQKTTRIIIPFESARENEAVEATSAAFKRLTRERISQPKYQKAIKQFLGNFAKARNGKLL